MRVQSLKVPSSLSFPRPVRAGLSMMAEYHEMYQSIAGVMKAHLDGLQKRVNGPGREEGGVRKRRGVSNISQHLLEELKEKLMQE
ncbi:hypothetical protein Bpfe_025202 [Biomphalaria pfeifferi]|uniref:Uncharacterized protein n=1 Tax=Biomphalaria pfeifferi TaxID=112525 RepID=A0AAD8B0W9_BIOPF|nr:hypothetical protein Bpfe_025202 [Biomphalaria pfeifferi]